MKLVNLTAEPVVLYAADRLTVLAVIKPDGTLALVRRFTRHRSGDYIPITKEGQVILIEETWARTVGLPEPVPGTYWIVTPEVRRAVEHRRDVLSPAYPVYSREKGVLLGHAALERNP